MSTPDFKNELSEIELVMETLGIGVVFAPKGHCETAGRGVECMGGAPKVFFRKANSKLSDDDRVNALKQRVRTSLDNVPPETIQKSARRARELELSYHTLLKDANVDLKLNEIEKNEEGCQRETLRS